MSKKGMTPERFAVDVLHGIGIPNPSKADIDFLTQWEAKEGGNWNNTARFNPLNTTLSEPGSVPYEQGKSVQAYTSWKEGLHATVSTLTESRYSNVVSALRVGNTSDALSALKASPWDFGHYAGWNPHTVGHSTINPGKVTVAGKKAARRLYDAGLRGNTLVMALATLGALTKGKFTHQTVSNYLISFKANGGHLKQTLGGSLYQQGKYAKYIGTAVVNLKAIGHAVSPDEIITTKDPGFEDTGGPSGIEQGAIDVSNAGGKVINGIESVPKLIGWITDPDNLIRIGFIVFALILLIVGLVKLTGSSLPNVKVGP